MNESTDSRDFEAEATANLPAEAGDMPTPPAHLQVPLAEEELQVGTRQVESGEVRVRKVVNTEHEDVPVELRREQVTVERTDAAGATVPDTAFREQEIEVPVMREEPVVAKEARVAGVVSIDKEVEAERETITAETRRENLEIDQDGVDEYVITPEERAQQR